MNYKTTLNYLIIPAILIITAGCSSGDDKQSRQVQKKAVNAILDDWHLAAEEANFERYFSHFAGDSAIFMGTDATERWSVPEFKAYARPHFDKGDAWNFTPLERHIYFSDEGRTVWFDETLDTPNLGPARGTGVLIWREATWKIAHYNLSIPIPNAIADTVVKQVEQTLQDSLSY